MSRTEMAIIVYGTILVVVAFGAGTLVGARTKSPRSATPNAETTGEGEPCTVSPGSISGGTSPVPSEIETESEEGVCRCGHSWRSHVVPDCDDEIAGCNECRICQFYIDPRDHGPTFKPPRPKVDLSEAAADRLIAAVFEVTPEEASMMAVDLEREARPLTYEPLPTATDRLAAAASAVIDDLDVDGYPSSFRIVEKLDALRVALAMVQHPAGGAL